MKVRFKGGPLDGHHAEVDGFTFRSVYAFPSERRERYSLPWPVGSRPGWPAGTVFYSVRRPHWEPAVFRFAGAAK